MSNDSRKRRAARSSRPRAMPYRQKDHVVSGMTAAVGAYFMFSVMIVFAKLLSANHSVIEIAFYRNVIGSIPFLIVVFAWGRRDILVIQSKPSLVGLRALVGVLSLSVTFYAFSIMPLADTTALLFASSLFIPILGILLLKESVGPYRWSAVVFGFVGIVVMSQPSGEVFIFGVAVALSAAMLHAIMQIMLRYLGRFESPETVSFYFLVIGALTTALALPFVAVAPTLREIPLLFGVGLSGATGQWLLSVAYSRAPAAVVTVFNYTSIIWATAFGWMIWNDWPTRTIFLGATIVIASNIMIIWRESRSASRMSTPI